MIPMEQAWTIIKQGEKPDLSSLTPSKPDLSSLLSKPSPPTDESSSRAGGAVCDFCGKNRGGMMWTQGMVPPGKNVSEGHQGALFKMCSRCDDQRRNHPEWQWTQERAERGY